MEAINQAITAMIILGIVSAIVAYYVANKKGHAH